MRSVGPTTNTNTASTTASTMLMFDSHWMPRAMPETAEKMNAIVWTSMMPMRSGAVASSTQPLNSRPAPICVAPMPSEAAEPKSVAKIASMSMTRPAQPSVRLVPSSGWKMEEKSCLRPLRNVP